MQNVKLIAPRTARNLAGSVLTINHGFFRISGSRDNYSMYYGFKGTSYKIRVSDHEDPFVNSDVKADIIIKEPTIESDVVYRVKRAVYDFNSRLRNKVIR